MKKYIQFFALLLTLFAVNTLSAQSGGTSAGKVSYSDLSVMMSLESEWDVKRVPDTDGRHVLATSKTGEGTIIVVLRDKKIAQIGHIPVGGSFKVLKPSTAAPCTGGPCLSFQIRHCFVIGGQCFCVCGAWITSYPGN